LVVQASENDSSAYRPKAFRCRHRETHPFWKSNEVKNAVEEVATFWKSQNMEIGDLQRIL